jgi:DNA-directed RNA polymerase subunit beta'
MKTTIGSILINDALPNPLRDYSAVFKKKTVNKTLSKLAIDYPDQYAEAVLKIKQLGDKIAYDKGASFSLEDLKPIKKKHEIISRAEQVFKDANKIKDKEIRTNFILDNIVKLRDEMKNTIKNDTVDTNRLTMQVESGSRGNMDQLNSMIGTPLLYSDHRDRPITTLIKRNFAEGLTPVEYWASSYGTRKGTVSTALGTAISGAFSKELNRAIDTLVVTEEDCGTTNGIYEEIDDPHLLGRYLASDHKRMPRNTLLTPEVIDSLDKMGYKKLKVRSPITCEATKGICTFCRGITEYNRRPVIGENVGLVSAQTITEPITQSSLSTKHQGGLAGRKSLAGSVLDMSKQMLNIPKNFINETPLAPVDGTITEIRKAPQGGEYITIDDDKVVYVQLNPVTRLLKRKEL